MHRFDLSARTLLALSTAAGALMLASTARAQEVAPDEEIVVTAQKREQTLQDIPQSISVVSAQRLERQQATNFVDYAALVPGLSLQQATPGETRVVLRGINTGGASPTTAIYIDETPFGASTGQSNGAVLAGDIDPFDLERVEVLRGPQGTLYGANSLGGVVRFITVAPRIGEFEGRARAGVETVTGGDMGWDANGVVNLPLGSIAALRASGFYREQGGFIDTLGIDRKDANDVTSYGGRASLLIKPSDTFSVRLTALAQNIRANSRAAYDADPVTLEPAGIDPETGAPTGDRLVRTQYYPDQNDVDYRNYNGTIDWDLGFASLVSATSYSETVQQEVTDASYELAGIGDVFFGDVGTPGPRGITLPARVSSKKFTQEVRLASPSSTTLEWLVGGYYTREEGLISQRYLPFALDTGESLDPSLTLPLGPGGADAVFPEFLRAELGSVYREYAGFGSATLHLGPRFDITAGARYSHNEQRTRQLLDGSLLPLSGGAAGPEITNGRSSEDVFTWSVSPRFEFSDHASIYARVAKGYRPGGPNVVPPGAGDRFPGFFEADTLISYEVGIRGETEDRSFALDASLYYLDWKNIQVLVVYQTGIGPVGADGNGDSARSQGAEVTATLRPTRGFDVVLNVAHNDATLREDLPEGNGGFAGDRLPYAPEWTANLSADYEWSVGNGATAFVGGNVRLVSAQEADFDDSYRTTFGRRLGIEGYATADLRVGARFGAFNVTAFAKNLGNSRGIINAGGFGTRPGSLVSASPIRPRTLGVTLGAGF
ncbi:TonB-dependent receptor [Sphingomonas xinjiangensis]|uniref:Outer membrane receptor protein involved in Fe transport n=1 Tax=Sphingomonas xinjiangensis TaxID=643568 RepID=A0A840YL70_9SPHN|nr:TonB-dependent receptor [Sphingomonas xinjiangensis]MBB5709960.1 outer membrane receptor protein involved in Fe transport [Sphingomonas xinjiangensis]